MGVTASQSTVKMFADRAGKESGLKAAGNPLIKGSTTNPTLMRKAGIAHYQGFARDILAAISDRPISFEAFSGDFDDTCARALEIAAWRPNVYVKNPITNAKGESAVPLLADSPQFRSDAGGAGFTL
jgi:transaldolase